MYAVRKIHELYLKFFSVINIYGSIGKDLPDPYVVQTALQQCI